MKISFERKLLLIFLSITLAVVVFTVITYHNNKSIADSNYWVNHTQVVLYGTEKVISDLKDVETGVRGYIITHDTAFLRPFHQSKDSILTNIKKLAALTRDNSVQQARIDTLYTLALKRIEQCTAIATMQPAELKDNEALLKIILDGKLVMDKIRTSVVSIKSEESRLLQMREKASAVNYLKAKNRFYILSGGISFLFLLAYLLLRYNFSILRQDSKIMVQLDKRLSFLSKRVDDTIEGIGDPFFALDENWKFIYLNTAAENAMGHKKGALIGKDIFQVFSDYKKMAIGQNLVKVQQSRQAISFEAYDDILKYWQDVTIYPTAEGITVYIKDATQRKANEHELLKTKQLLEETNEVAMVGGWEVDLLKGTVYWTSMTRTIHETEPGYVPDLQSGLHFYKEGANRDAIIKMVDDAITHRKNWDAPLQIVTAKGKERWVRTKGKAEFDRGQCVRLIGTFQDITDQKKLEQKLTQSEKQFRSAFEYSAIGMALVSPGGKWEKVNGSLCNIIGYSQEELFKLTFGEITHPEDLQKDLELLQELIEGKRQSYQLEKRYLHKDGHHVWILLAVSAVRDPDGNIVHFIAQIQDISEKKQAEKELVEERQLLRTIIDNIPLNVYLKDLQSRKILVNKSEIEYMGAKTEMEILGKNDYDLYPDDSAIISIEEDREVFKTGIPIIDRETVSFKNDGTETWFLTSKIPFRNAQNEITGLLGISYDITARNQTRLALQESEQKLSTLFDLSPVGFVLNDYYSGQFLEFNDSFIKNMGYTREEFTHLDYKAITPEEDWGKETDIRTSVSETGYFGPLEQHYIKKNGSSYPVLLNGLKIRDAKGRELLWTVVQDITDLKFKERELQHLNNSIQERNKELAIKNEELEQFAYVASHDLQEPLRMVTGFLSKIEKKYKPLLDEEGKKYIHFAVDGAIRMRSLITDILNYSSLGGDSVLNNVEIDLNKMIREIVTSLQNEEKERHAEIVVDHLPVVHAGKTYMQQLFSNLIANAVKYQAPGNKPVIKIKADEMTDHWKFSIADNGIGIDPKSFHKVFNVFQRLHNKEQYSGTGIGLAICKKIINNLKGDIWLDSQAGRGTTFYFTIPK